MRTGPNWANCLLSVLSTGKNSRVPVNAQRNRLILTKTLWDFLYLCGVRAINAERVADGRGFEFPTGNVAIRLSSVHALSEQTGFEKAVSVLNSEAIAQYAP